MRRVEHKSIVFQKADFMAVIERLAKAAAMHHRQRSDDGRYLKQGKLIER